MKLTTLFRTSSILLWTLIFAISLLLIYSTTFIKKSSERIQQSLHGLYAAEEVELNLLIHNRESSLMSSDKTGHHENQKNRAERQLLEWVNTVGNARSSSEGSLIFKRAEEDVRNYLETRKRLEARNIPSAEVYKLATESVDRAYASLEQVVEFELARAERNAKQADFHDRLANWLGTGSVIFSLLLLTGYILLFKTYIYKPLLDLQSSIAKYSGGDLDARASSEGVSELKQIADTFNKMADRLSHQRETQLRFLAGVAHDFRNPLGAINMAVEFMPEETEAKERRQILDIIKRQIKNLDRLSGDLLDMTRIESGQLEIKKEEVDLRRLIQDSYELYQSSSPTHRLILKIPDKPLPGSCDPLRISQVFNNLISNAIKYSPNGGDVLIEAQNSDKKIIVTITDQGLGISPMDLKNIFQAFRRSDAVREAIPGVGLGLSVAKKIIKAHQGELTVKSALGHGSTFQVELPILVA